MNEHTSDVTNGLHRLEGYLFWQAEVATAERDAAAFTELLPSLTTGQREEVALAYAQDRLRVSRQTLIHIRERCRALRGEYEERYHRLRSRLVALFATVLALDVLALAVLTYARQ